MHTDQHTREQEKQREGLSRVTQHTVAAVVGIGTGLAGLIGSTHREFREKLPVFDFLKKDFAEHGAKIGGILKDRTAGKISLGDYIKNTRTTKVDFERTLAQKVESTIGITSSVFNEAGKLDIGKGLKVLTKGTAQRVGMLGASRDGVIFKTIVATTIGFAGTMMFFNSLHTRNTLDDIDDKIDALGDKLSAQGKGR